MQDMSMDTVSHIAILHGDDQFGPCSSRTVFIDSLSCQAHEQSIFGTFDAEQDKVVCRAAVQVPDI
jgi:hypothetical protein